MITEDPEYTPRENIVNGLTPDSFWGGDIHITSAAPNAYAHVYSSQKRSRHVFRRECK